MMAEWVVQVRDGWTYLSGQVNLGNLNLLLQNLLPRINENPRWQLDLSGVSSCDSASLALLLACLRQGRQSGVEISFRNLPACMRRLSSLFGIVNILPLEDAP